jgi:hypothetical protein
MTVPGIDFAVALALVAAIGDVHRFASPQKLVSYLGLDPRVRQSGNAPSMAHLRITKIGRSHARGMLVEAAWAVARTPGPLRAFFDRIRARRGPQIAAVALARKLAVLVWYLNQPRPGLPVGASSSGRLEVPPPRASRWSTVASGPAWRRGQLLGQRRPAPAGPCPVRRRRDGVPTPDSQLEAPRAPARRAARVRSGNGHATAIAA